MTGQDAVRSAKAFNEALELDGVIMTKLDGDARGGAALSVKAVTGVPIKFVGTGEHLDALEEFHPDRMAGRILGMGDVLTLVEQAQQKFDQEEMAQQEARLRKGEFTLDDFKKHARADEEARADEQDHGHDPRHGQHGRDAGRHRRRAGHAPLGRHHRLDDARRAPQPVEDRSTRAAAAASPPGPASSRTKSTSWSSSSTPWPT